MAWILESDLFKCDKDTDLGKVAKRRRLNPVGEDAYLCPVTGLVTLDEHKIIAAQRIWKREYYKPGGKWFIKADESFKLKTSDLGTLLS